jgi:hypothetical protein
VGEPVLILGEGLVDAIVEVLVVGENNVATDIVQLVNSQFVPVTIEAKRNLRSPRRSHRWKRDHREFRWNQ